MSGYFGALLRASGLGTGPPAAPAPDFSLEHDMQVEPFGAPAVTPAPPLARKDGVTGMQAAAAPLPPVTPPHPADMVVPASAASVQAPAPSASVTGERVQPAATPARLSSDVPAAGPARAQASTPATSAGHTAIQAALHWVAADPALAPAPAARSPVPAPAVTPSAAAPAYVTPAAAPARAPQPVATPARPAMAAVFPSFSPSVSPSLSPPLSPPLRDEPVDITIGAIHVRVDAPAVQASTAPRAPAVAEARPVRSGLARRALRRL